MRAIRGYSALFIFLAACSGKNRPFAEGPGAAPDGASSDPAVTTPSEAPPAANGSLQPVAGGGEGASLPGVENGVDPSGAMLGASANAASECGADAGECSSDAAARAPCVPTGPRDCSSDQDNDCDGRPDDVADDFCRCVPGTIEVCDEHSGLDGLGVCRAGSRTCVAASAATGSDWSACEGALGPGQADSCSVDGDDSNCNGIPNEGCACVNGSTQACGSSTDIGVCAFGTSTCVDGAYQGCVGATPPAARDSCAVRGDDSNCNGLANEGCACIDGETRACGPQNVGVCRSGVQTCADGRFGGCVGAVNAGPRNCNSPADNDCDGRPDNTIDNVCLPSLPTGATCTADSQCASSRCESWFRDRDADGFGTTDDIQRTCGSLNGASLPPNGYSATSGDCCDLGGAEGVQARTIFPGQTQFFDVPQAICPVIADRDYNCSGDIEFLFQDETARGNGGCAFIGCNGATVWDVAQTGGTPPACGTAGPILRCSGASGACTGTPDGFTLNFCH